MAPFIAGTRARIKRTVKQIATKWYQGRTPRRTDPDPALWRLARNSAGELCLDGTSLRSLLRRFGSPLHVVDAQALDTNIADFLAPPPGQEHGCEVYYSYKTNPVPAVLRRMHDRGIGAEVISAYELWLALRLGVPPEKIVYNGPAKSDESLHLAIDREICLLNLNCREEIPRVVAAARRVGKRPRIALRVVLPDGWGGQFGEPVVTGAAFRAFEEALAHPELNVVGLHIHRGAEISERDEVVRFAGEVLAFTDSLREKLGLELEILDFGGSLACRTTRSLSARDVRMNRTFLCDLQPRRPESVLSIRDYVATLFDCVFAHYRQLSRKMPRIFVEPGRAMTASTQMLLSQVMMTKAFDENLTYAILDAGINLADSVRNEYHQIFPVGDPEARPKKTYRLAGPICTPGDVLVNAWDLPELSPGDPIAIMDAGAYFVPFSTSFSFPQPAIVWLEQGESTLVRRAETFEDLVVLDEIEHARSDRRSPGRVPLLRGSF
ncbi:MAG: hypothetical protein SFU56_15430 [Capsulimonadales bacterium]|nr:hypothetical protein [Capsulimonadales bacterium]